MIPIGLLNSVFSVKASRNADGTVTLAISQPEDRKDSAPTPDDTPLTTPVLSRVPSVADLQKSSGLPTPREPGTEIDDHGARGIRAMGGF